MEEMKSAEGCNDIAVDSQEVVKIKNDLTNSILDLVGSDLGKPEDHVEVKLRVKILELSLLTEVQIRSKWKMFCKYAEVVESTLLGIPRSRVGKISFKRFQSYYKAVIKERDDLARSVERKESEV